MKIDRAIQAEKILNDPLVKEAFALIHTNLHEKFEATTANQKQEREDIWMQLNAMRNFKQFFKRAIRDGKIEMMKEKKDGDK